MNQQREYIRQHNDGSQPAEPGQRCSQIIFEAWLKEIILKKRLVTSRFGWKYVAHTEQSDGVIATFMDYQGQNHTVRSQYLVACDGGGSRVRKTAGIRMIGGQM